MTADAPAPNGEAAVPVGTKSPRDFSFSRYRIDLGTRAITAEQVQCQDLDDVLGGAARGYKLLDGVAVDDPYAASVPLILNLGILSGTEVMTGLRTFFHAYSPLKTSLAGKPSAMWTAGSGKFGTKLRYLGIDEIIFTGRAEKPIYLRITPADNGGVYFLFGDASDLHGKRVNEKIQDLHERFPEAHFAVIGPAGENYHNVRFAAIALSTVNQLKSGDMKSRFCGRGGIGGVMGSKNLLAIIADTPDKKGEKAPPMLKDLNQLVARGEGSRRFRDKHKGNGGGGTWSNVNALHPVSAMPEFNFVPSGNPELSKPLYRDTVEQGPYIVKDEACFRCGIACHKNMYDKTEDGKAGEYRAKFDFEPLNLLSSNIGIFDIDQAAVLVELTDDLCMDSISLGVTISYAMEYNKRHRGGRRIAGGISYGDYEATKRAIEAIGQGFMPHLGQGSKRLAESVGETGYAMHSKGMEFPAYLPQTNPGYPWALAGGHMSMRTYLLYLFEREAGMDYWVDAITNRGWAILRDDVIGICKFSGLPDVRVAEAIVALTGLRITDVELKAAVRRTFLRGYKLERQQGFTRDDYVMPAEVHDEYKQVELPYFNSKAFFDELRDKVCDRLDAMLAAEGI